MRSSKPMACPANYYTVTAVTGFAALEAAVVNTASVPMMDANAPQPQRETTMIDQEIEQRRYLLNRTASVQGNKMRELEKFFGIYDDDRPTSPEDLIKRVTDGKYVLTAKDELHDDEDGFCGYAFERLHWRDPAQVRDREGYKAALQRMNVAAQKANDKTRLMSIADGFKAFEEFEATDFTTIH